MENEEKTNGRKGLRMVSNKPVSIVEKHPLVIAVAYNIRLDENVRLVILMAFVEYLLYVRAQIPGMVPNLRHQKQDLLQDAKNSDNKRKGNQLRNFRRLDRLLNALDEFSTFFKSLFGIIPVDLVTIVIGSSIVSPREVFLLSYTNLEANDTNGKELEKSKVDAIAKKLVRSLVSEANLLNDCPCSKTYILFRVSRQESGFPELLLRGDLVKPKPNFDLRKLKLRYNSTPVHLVNVQSKTAEDSSVDSLEQFVPSETFSWFLFSKPFVGFQ